MVTILGQQSTENTARLELRALERMIGALCEHTERLARVTRTEAPSREADFQLQAFSERRTQALKLLAAQTGESYETRIARLEKLVEALDCSRDYFRPSEAEVETSEWAIRVS